MAQPCPTISAALTPKCPSGRGAATPSPVPQREYWDKDRELGETGVEETEIPPGCISQVTAGDTAWLKQLCWGMGQGTLLCVPGIQ